MLGNGKRIWQPTAMQERKSLRMNKEQKQFLLSSLFSGIMIGIGCTVYLSCVNKLVGALLFCAGLFFILTNGGTLFTGICGLKTPVKKLVWVFVLNGLGTVIPAIVCGFEHSIADMGYLAIAIPNLSFWQILQCMGMILVIMLGNVFGSKLMRMVLVDWQEKDA